MEKRLGTPAVFCLLAGILLGIGTAVHAQDSLRRPVMQLEIEEVQLEEPGTTDEEYDYVVETPTPTPEPAIFSILSESEREVFAEKGTVVRRSLPYSQEPLIIGSGFTPSDFIFTEKKHSTPVELEGKLSVFANQPFGYQIVTLQQDYLKTLTGIAIESVSCDVSGTRCTTTTPGTWNLTQTYGLGYRVGTSTLYRPFPVRSKDDSAVTVLSKPYQSQPGDIPFFVKLNLPPSFQEGTYSSEVLLITMPKP